MGAGSEAALAVVLRLRNEMQEQLGGVRSQLQSFAGQAAMVGGALTAGVSLPLLAIAKDAINVASTFEGQMNVLAVAARNSGTGLAELQKAALLVGKDTQLVGINSQEAADAMTNFYKAGLDTADIFGGQLNGYLEDGTNLTGALRSAIDLAAASEMDLNQASMLTAASMATFGLKADDTARIANSFVGAADASLASVNDLAMAMQNIGPTAAAFGWSLEETNTALALLSTRGIMGAEAGTALKSMMTNMMSGTKDTTAALSALNVSLYDSQGNMLPLPNIIGQLSGAMAGMTEEQRNSYVQTLAGTFGMKALNTLLAEGTPGWTNMTTAIATAATAQETAAARTQGLQSAWEQFRGAIETVYISVGLPLIQNFLTPLVQRVTEIISGITSLNPQVMNAALAFGAVLAVAGPVVLAMSGVAAVVAALLSPIGLIVLAVAALAAAWATDFGGIRELTAQAVAAVGPVIQQIITWVQTNLPAALATLRSTWESVWGTIQTYAQVVIGLLLPLISGFVSGAVGFFTTTWPLILSTVKGVLDQVWAVVQQVLGVVLLFVATHGDEIKKAIGGAWTIIQGIVQTALAIIRETVIPILTAIAGFIRDHGAEIQRVLDAAWAIIKGVVKGALEFIQGILQTILLAIHGDWAGAWDKLKETGERLWTTIKETIKRVAEDLGPILAKIWEDIKAKAAEAWEAMKTKAAEAWEAIKSKAAEMWNNVKEAIKEKIEDALKAVVKWLDDTLVKIENFDLKAAAKKFFGTILPGIIEQAAEALAKVAGWLQDVWNKISKHDLKGATTTSFATVVAGIAAKIPDILRNVGSFLTDAAAKIKGYSFKSQTLTAIQTVVVGILEKVGNILTAVSDFLIKIQTTIAEFSLFDVGVGLMNGLIDGVKSKVADMINSVYGAVRDAVDAAKNLLGISSPSTVFAEIGRQVLEGLILGIDEKKAEAAKTVADAIASICEAAVKAADALRNFRPVDNLGLVTGKVLEFLLGVETQFQALVQQVDEKLAVKAKEFAEAAAPVMGLISTGLASLRALGEGITYPSELIPKLHGLSDYIGQIVYWMGTIGNVIAAELQTAAKTFAENAGPPVGLVAAALESVRALGAGITYPSDLIPKLHGLSDYIGQIVYWMGTIANAIAPELQTAAKTFAENAGPPVGLVAAALESVRALGAGITYPSDLIGKLHGLSDYIGQIVYWMGTIGNVIAAELQTAAKTFADNAGPVVDLVTGALEALKVLADPAYFIDLGMGPSTSMFSPFERLGQFLQTLVTEIGKTGQLISGELQTAAKTLADNAGPVVDLVSGALEALKALADPAYYIDLGMGPSTSLFSPFERLGQFLQTLITEIGRIGKLISGELQTAAKSLADNAGPVFTVVKDALELIKVLEAAKAPDLAVLGEILTGIGDAISLITTRIGALQGTVGTLLAGVSAFAENVGQVLADVTTTLNTLKVIGELEAPKIGLAWVTELLTAMSAAVPSLEDVLAFILSLFTDFHPSGYNAGLTFMSTLASGIRAGMSEVEAALAAVAALFPHSPAKAGPLKQAPDWNAYLSMGLDDAASRVANLLSGVGGGGGMSLAPVLASGGRGGMAPVRGGGYGATVINFTYAPTVSLASQREAQEVIAPMLAEVLRREARRG